MRKRTRAQSKNPSREIYRLRGEVLRLAHIVNTMQTSSYQIDRKLDTVISQPSNGKKGFEDIEAEINKLSQELIKLNLTAENLRTIREYREKSSADYKTAFTHHNRQHMRNSWIIVFAYQIPFILLMLATIEGSHGSLSEALTKVFIIGLIDFCVTVCLFWLYRRLNRH